LFPIRTVKVGKLEIPSSGETSFDSFSSTVAILMSFGFALSHAGQVRSQCGHPFIKKKMTWGFSLDIYMGN
jgi:hypothetical protein